MQQNQIIHNIAFPFIVASTLDSTSQPIKHGQSVHILWQKHGCIVRVLRFIPFLYQGFNSFFNQSSTVINSWRDNLVVIKGLRSLTCYKCDKENFYIEIQTSIQSEFLSLLDGKFVCPKCKEKME